MKTLASFAVACTLALAVQAAPQFSAQDQFRARLAAAESGNAEAQFSVGEAYERGDSAVPIDLTNAFRWFDRAARQNHPQAQFRVAYMLYRGEGTEANSRKAFELMEKLAARGFIRAQYYLGLMYETGAGSAKDAGQAQAWYKRAATNGYSPAVDALAELKAQLATTEASDSTEPERARAAQPAKVAPAPQASRAPAPPARRPEAPGPEAPKPEAAAANPVPADPAGALLGTLAPGTELAPKVEIGTTTPPLPKTEPEVVAEAATIQPAIQAPPTTRSLLIDGNWMSQGNTPSEFLPSKVTTCEKSGPAGLECLSKEISNTIANTQIVFQTRATISAIQPTGEFRIAYRNNVVKIVRDAPPSDEGEAPAGGPNVKLGWQDTEHHLECKLESSQTVHCVKNQTQKMTLKNRTAL
jgi:hypothetical protein